MHAAWNTCAHGSAVARPCASPRPPTSGSRQIAHVSAPLSLRRASNPAGGVELPRRAARAGGAPSDMPSEPTRPRFAVGGALVPRRADADGADADGADADGAGS